MPTYTREFFNGPANSGLNSFLVIHSDGTNLGATEGRPGQLLHTVPAGAVDVCHFLGATANVIVYASGAGIITFKHDQNLDPRWQLSPSITPSLGGSADNGSTQVTIDAGQSLWIHYTGNSPANPQTLRGWIDRITGQ